MEHLKYFLVVVLLSPFVFSSCTKEEDGAMEYSGKARLLFGTVMNDLVAKNDLKQSLPSCTDNAPAFVEVVLSGPTNVGSMSDPLVVSVNPVPGNFDGDSGAEYFTNESSELELEAGTYTLEFFAVYDGDPALPESNRIWVAPMKGGSLADFVDLALPMDFNLRAGVKKYLDVEVLCFDERLVNEYGYQFFDIETRKAIEFCLFANYCPEGNRDFPAAYSVEVYMGTNNSAPVLYSGIVNTTRVENGIAYAEPLCLPLPDLPAYADDEEYLYYEVTLLEWDGVYEYVETEPFFDTLSRNDIEGNFGPDNTVFYEHLRFGCEDPCPSGTLDTDEDGVPDECDPCPLVPAGLDNDGDCSPNNEDQCPNDPENKCEPEEPCMVLPCGKTETSWMKGDHTLTKKDNDGLSLSGKWGWAEEFSTSQPETTFGFYAAAGNNDISKGFLAGEVHIDVDGQEVKVTIVSEADVNFNKLDIYLSDQEPTKAAPGNFRLYGGLTDEEPCSTGENIYLFEYSGDGSFWIMVHGDVCQAKRDL